MSISKFASFPEAVRKGGHGMLRMQELKSGERELKSRMQELKSREREPKSRMQELKSRERELKSRKQELKRGLFNKQAQGGQSRLCELKWHDGFKNGVVI